MFLKIKNIFTYRIAQILAGVFLAAIAGLAVWALTAQAHWDWPFNPGILPPTNISVSATSYDSVTLTWTASSAGGNGVDHYDVQNITLPLKPEAYTTGAATIFTWTGLEQGKCYNFKVKTCDLLGQCGSWSSPSVQGCTQSLGFPTWALPSHSNNTTNSITWDWNKLTGATSYNVKDSSNGIFSGCSGVSGDFCTATFPSPSANTRYGAEVQGCLPNGCGPWSEGGALAYTSIQSASGASFSSIGQTSFTVTANGTISAPNPNTGPYTDYIRFELRNGSDTNCSGNGLADSGWKNSTSHDFTGLACGTQYKVCIQTRNGDGDANSDQGPFGPLATSGSNQSSNACTGTCYGDPDYSLTDNDNGNQGGTYSGDGTGACCLNANYCIDNGFCYGHGTYKNLTSNVYGFCYGGQWLDCDGSDAAWGGGAGSSVYCGPNIPANIKAGSAGVGEYDNTNVVEYCGDDLNENVVTTDCQGNSVSVCCPDSALNYDSNSGACVASCPLPDLVMTDVETVEKVPFLSLRGTK